MQQGHGHARSCPRWRRRPAAGRRAWAGEEPLLDYAAASAGPDRAPCLRGGIRGPVRLGGPASAAAADPRPAGQPAGRAGRGAARRAPARSRDGDDPFLVSLALLTLLSRRRWDRPPPGAGLIGLVDDAQWLDDQSADALRFVARRLDRDQIGLVVAARDAPPSRFALDPWPRIDLTGLAADGMTDLLSQRAAGVSPRVRNGCWATPAATRWPCWRSPGP